MTLYNHITEHLFTSFVVLTVYLWMYLFKDDENTFSIYFILSLKTFHHWAAHSHSSVITCTLSNLYPVKAGGGIVAVLCQEKDLADASSQNPSILPLSDDPEILTGFKMSNYITAFL